MTQERHWDAAQATAWLRLRDEAPSGEQWIRVDGASLGLGAFLEPLGAGPPEERHREAHRAVAEAGRRRRSEAWAARTSGRRAVLAGLSTAPFACAAARRLLPCEGVARLLRSGYIVAEALRGERLRAFVEEMARLDDGFNLAAPPQHTPGQRGDRIAWMDEDTAANRFGAPAVASAIRLLRGVADALNPALSQHHAARAAARDPARQWPPEAPATPERVLTAPLRAMAASYPGGGARYVPHKDNAYRKERGDRINTRELTAILYANPADWSLPAHGGALRLYPGSEDAEEEPPEAPQSGWNARGDRELLCRAGPGPVTIAPTGGRLVIFFSALWHEVMPAHRVRRALTMWILRPDAGSVDAHAADTCAWGPARKPTPRRFAKQGARPPTTCSVARAP